MQGGLSDSVSTNKFIYILIRSGGDAQLHPPGMYEDFLNLIAANLNMEIQCRAVISNQYQKSLGNLI